MKATGRYINGNTDLSEGITVGYKFQMANALRELTLIALLMAIPSTVNAADNAWRQKYTAYVCVYNLSAVVTWSALSRLEPVVVKLQIQRVNQYTSLSQTVGNLAHQSCASVNISPEKSDH